MLNPETATAIFPYEHTVLADEVEAAGNASCLAYLLWTRQASIGHSTAQGWPPERFLEIGAAWTVRSHNIHYLKPALTGQQVVVHTWVANFEKTRVLCKYKIFRPADNSLLVVAETNWTLVDTTTNRPKQIPVELTESFSIVSEADEP